MCSNCNFLEILNTFAVILNEINSSYTFLKIEVIWNKLLLQFSRNECIQFEGLQKKKNRQALFFLKVSLPSVTKEAKLKINSINASIIY